MCLQMEPSVTDPWTQPTDVEPFLHELLSNFCQERFRQRAGLQMASVHMQTYSELKFYMKRT